MRCFDNGCFFSVCCDTTDVYKFARRWPCFGSDDSVTFQFDKRTGDLVDINPPGRSDKSDGTGLCALADDAKAYGLEMLRKRAESSLRKQASVTVHAGCIEVTAMLDGALRRMKFSGYTKTQALREFCQAWAHKVEPAISR